MIICLLVRSFFFLQKSFIYNLLTHLCPVVHVLILIYEGIVKKISYERKRRKEPILTTKNRIRSIKG